MANLEMAAGVLTGGLGLMGALVAYRRAQRPEGVLAYLREVGDEEQWEREPATDPLDGTVVDRVVRPALHHLAARAHSLLPSSYLDDIHAKLLRAGLSQRIRAEEFATVHALAAVGGLLFGGAFAILTHGSALMRLLVLLVLVLMGAVGPRAWLSGKADARASGMERELPDVLDLLTISVEAGLGLEAAMESVCHDSDSPLGQELGRTLQEMNLGLSRSQALENLKNRNDVEDLSTFILVLTQADVLGMPIGRVLRTQADQMRERRRSRAREKAAKLPVKILFPLMLFILPALMVVVLGPAAINAYHAFKHH